MKIADNYKKINDLISKSSSVFVTAHKGLDLDALGGCLGMYNYIIHRGKPTYVVVDDKYSEAAVSKVMKRLSSEISIINSAKAIKLKNESSLLIIVDTNKKYLLQNSNLADAFSNKLIIDHHGEGEGTIDDVKLMIIDSFASSTCEIITEFLKLNDFKIDSYLATILLSGIVLDTCNYVLKTSSNTFYYSYYLSTCGANNNQVQYLLKQDLKKYIKRQKMITNVKIINNIAITKAVPNDVYRPEELAKTADTLLLFNNIEASFVIANVDKKTIGISARSLGNIKVGQVLGLLGGGGDNHEAASKIQGSSLSKVEKDLLNIIKLL